MGSGIVVDFPRVHEDGSEVEVPTNYGGPHLQRLSSMPSGSSQPPTPKAGTEEDKDRWRDGHVPRVVRALTDRKAGEGKREATAVLQAGVATPSGALRERKDVVGSVGKERVTKWRLLLHQIGVDVMRADRALQFFEDEGNRFRLMETLACYAWYDSEVGYCQGEKAGWEDMGPTRWLARSGNPIT